MGLSVVKVFFLREASELFWFVWMVRDCGREGV